jgi:hypothetical protein
MGLGTRRQVLMGVALLVSATGCGPSLSGTVGGNALQVKDVISAVFSISSSGQTFEGVILLASSRDGLCEMLSSTSYPQKANESDFMVALTRQGSSPFTATGYALGNPNDPAFGTKAEQYAATFTASDDACASTHTESTGGSLTIKTLASDKIDFEVDALFGNGEIKGSASAPRCTAYESLFGTGKGPTPSAICEK